MTLENRPHLVPSPLDKAACTLHIGDEAVFHQFVHDEGFEELERHLFRQTALIYLEVRSDHDHRAPGIIHALSQKILAETSLLSPQKIGEALERPVAAAQNRLSPPAVVDEGVDGLLQHPLLVADDDIGSLQLLQLFQAIVAVDHPPVQIVEIGGGESSAVELDHGTKIRWDDRQDGEHHPLRTACALAKILGDLEAFYQFTLLLPGRLCDLLAERTGEVLQVHPLQE